MKKKSLKLTICVHVLKLFSLSLTQQTNKLECLSLLGRFRPVNWLKNSLAYLSVVSQMKKKSLKFTTRVLVLKLFYFVSDAADK
jgi:hypothetical protein